MKRFNVLGLNAGNLEDESGKMHNFTNNNSFSVQVENASDDSAKLNIITPENYQMQDVLFRFIMAINPKINLEELNNLSQKLQNSSSLLLADEHYLSEYGVSREILNALVVLKKFRDDSLNFAFKNQSLLKSWADFTTHLKLQIAGISEEKFYIFYLDIGHRIVAEQCIESGFVDKINVNFRNIIKKFTNIGAKYVVLAHNHPSGVVYPSKEDIEITTELADLLRAVDGVVYDHIIISNDDSFSFRRNNLI